MSYDVKRYERNQLKERVTEKYPALMWHDHLDQFKIEYPDDFEAKGNNLNKETVSLGFLDNCNKGKYGHIIVGLHDDFLKKEEHYSVEISVIYKLLDEYSNDKRAIDSISAEAPYLAFG